MKLKSILQTALKTLTLGTLIGLATGGCGYENPIKNTSGISRIEVRGKWYNQHELTQAVVYIYKDPIFKAIKNVEVVGDDVVLTGDFQRISGRDVLGIETRVPFDKAVVQIGNSDTPHIDAPRLGFKGGVRGLGFILAGFSNHITWKDQYWIDMDPSIENWYQGWMLSE